MKDKERKCDFDGIADAFKFPAKAHLEQTRKETEIPYIVHLMDVASILLKRNATKEVVIAGLLHDTVEDTEVKLAHIGAEFGKKVEELVRKASDPEELIEGDSNAEKEIRKIETW